MRAFILSIAVFTAISTSGFCAEDKYKTTATKEREHSSEIQIPSGMELRRSGRDVDVVVPEGSKFDKIGDVTLIENADEYAAERFKTVDERLDKIEEEQAALKSDK